MSFFYFDSMDKNKTLFILDDNVPSTQESDMSKFFTQGRHMEMSLIKPTFQVLSCIICEKPLDDLFNIHGLCTSCYSQFKYECVQRQKECKVQLPMFMVPNLCYNTFHNYPTEESPTHLDRYMWYGYDEFPPDKIDSDFHLNKSRPPCTVRPDCMYIELGPFEAKTKEKKKRKLRRMKKKNKKKNKSKHHHHHHH